MSVAKPCMFMEQNRQILSRAYLAIAESIYSHLKQGRYLYCLKFLSDHPSDFDLKLIFCYHDCKPDLLISKAWPKNLLLLHVEISVSIHTGSQDAYSSEKNVHFFDPPERSMKFLHLLRRKSTFFFNWPWWLVGSSQHRMSFSPYFFKGKKFCNCTFVTIFLQELSISMDWTTTRHITRYRRILLRVLYLPLTGTGLLPATRTQTGLLPLRLG